MNSPCKSKMPYGFELNWTVRWKSRPFPPAPKTIVVTFNLRKHLAGIFMPHEVFEIGPGEQTIAIIYVNRDELCNNTDLIAEPLFRMRLQDFERHLLIQEIIDLVSSHPNLSQIVVDVRSIYRRVSVVRRETVRSNPATPESIAALEDDLSCVICIEKLSPAMEVSRLPCSHVFHGVCIADWLKLNCLCPVCRFQMPRVNP